MGGLIGGGAPVGGLEMVGPVEGFGFFPARGARAGRWWAVGRAVVGLGETAVRAGRGVRAERIGRRKGKKAWVGVFVSQNFSGLCRFSRFFG